MKNLRKKLIMLFVLASIISLTVPTYVKAAVQANGGTPAKKNFSDWILGIRHMEALGGTLGLSETVDSKSLLATTKSNGIDCHLQKNTEYGALAILSASAYGNPNVIKSGNTTTGNATGVKMNINIERVAAVGKLSASPATAINSRYIEEYRAASGNKSYIGDAMNIATWHASDMKNIWFNDDGVGLVRAFNKTIFSYDADNSSAGKGKYGVLTAARAVIVVGSDL